jgi:hypothetical protein
MCYVMRGECRTLLKVSEYSTVVENAVEGLDRPPEGGFYQPFEALSHQADRGGRAQVHRFGTHGASPNVKCISLDIASAISGQA